MKTTIQRRLENGVETHRETVHEIFSEKRRYAGPWRGMMQISFEGMAELQERLADHTLGVQAVRVLVLMLEHMDRNNECRAGVKDLARLLKMDQSDVSKALRKLVDCGFVEAPRLRFAPYTVSPRFAWKASADKLKAALASRGMLDKTGMMKAREAA